LNLTAIFWFSGTTPAPLTGLVDAIVGTVPLVKLQT
jgi:hypothetical protein